MKQIDKYLLQSPKEAALLEASTIAKVLAKEHTNGIMKLRNVISELNDFLQSEPEMSKDMIRDLKKAEKALDMVDGTLARLVMELRKVTV